MKPSKEFRKLETDFFVVKVDRTAYKFLRKFARKKASHWITFSLNLQVLVNMMTGVIVMNKKPFDDSNWREELIPYTNSKKELELLENGPKSLSQSWMMGALYQKWEKIFNHKDPEPPDCQSNLKDSLKKFDEIDPLK